MLGSLSDELGTSYLDSKLSFFCSLLSEIPSQLSSWKGEGMLLLCCLELGGHCHQGSPTPSQLPLHHCKGSHFYADIRLVQSKGWGLGSILQTLQHGGQWRSVVSFTVFAYTWTVMVIKAPSCRPICFLVLC